MRDIRGPLNPNFKNAGWRVCETCSQKYHSYNNASRFCSRSCRSRHPTSIQRSLVYIRAAISAKIQKALDRRAQKRCIRCNISTQFSSKYAVYCAECQREIKAESNQRRALFGPPKPNAICIYCSSRFYTKERGRKYCSYQCHLDSGGARRAGLAAAKAILKKYGAKKDANHNEIFNVLRLRCAVYDLSHVGFGVPDGAAWIASSWQLFDVKNPKTSYGKRGLNDVQKKWLARQNGGPVYILRTVEQAERFSVGDFSGIEFETPDSCS